MPKQMKIKSIVIQGYRWFDRINGNTYHSVYVTVNQGMKDQITYENRFEYGYGDQWRYTGINLLIDNGVIKFDKNTPAWQIFEKLRSQGIVIVDSVSDVSRKKDL